jgi:hypothetical protein
MSEPISPELVLVDPDLARDDRTWLREPAWRRAAEGASRRNGVPRRAPTIARVSLQARWQYVIEPARRHVRHVLLGASIFANGLLAAIALAASNAERTTVVVTPPPVTSVAAAQGARGSSSRTSNRQRARGRSSSTNHERPTSQTAPVRKTRAAIERTILGLLVQYPGGKLPSALIDESTGLAKNNLQAVCRQTQRTTYLCKVRPSRHRPEEGLTVRYRVTRSGRGVVTWGRYRAG